VSTIVRTVGSAITLTTDTSTSVAPSAIAARSSECHAERGATGSLTATTASGSHQAWASPPSRAANHATRAITASSSA